MKWRIHADDLAASRGVTDAILACHDHGPLTSVSILANGPDFDRAMDEVARRPGLELAVHLNLIEGTPLTDPDQIPDLVRPDGAFKHGFGSLWVSDLARGPRGRAGLRRQIGLELEAQIRRVQDRWKEPRPLALDGHQHLHVLPCVFEPLSELAVQWGMTRIRLPRQVQFHGPGGFKNAVKGRLLASLSRRALSRAPGDIRPVSQQLHTGTLCLAVVERIVSTATGRDTLEMLFHPGGAAADEAGTWKPHPALGLVYTAEARKQEAEMLCSDALRDLLGRYSRS